MDASKTDAGVPADAPHEQLNTAPITQATSTSPAVSAPVDGVNSTETKEHEPKTTETPSNGTTIPSVETPVSADNGATATVTQQKDHTIDKTKPEDFDGEVTTNNELPSDETIKKVENYIVLDRDGKSRTFKSLYSGNNVARRVLVVFIRHFFCGNCQEYLRTLSESITPDALLQLPVSTFIVVVGCGDPALINMYIEATNCPFPLYTDPTRALFDELGMTKTLALGAKPAYMKKSLWRSTLDSIGQGLKVLPQGLSLKSGDQRQVGGEFLFEPLDIVTPITTPQDEQPSTVGSIEDPSSGGRDRGDDGSVEEKRVTWCHRMKTTRDHAEIPELMEILGLDGQGFPIKDQERWARAVQARKGTGLTMASEMSKLGESSKGKEAKEA
ncbi:ahpC/TSA antioxidant enzyme domain-containing protein [Pochonia chlamydosporia 170]|uniref:AhpC/TSA antioxidant enzyme domain-containing protein n=1 Tax=Pochonia chlamydosporia 170 TaxID=1380566 RepID=A0A179F8B1_METCM|nr:ahpC/TSA antioxidant enzyme domain-containing protein [Pochonia chlamydosporia 170]OAQ61725.1 ahpC/TSA antioxidant enzyme domain-containing protein [Pochonia chlamydosporia 170]